MTPRCLATVPLEKCSWHTTSIIWNIKLQLRYLIRRNWLIILMQFKKRYRFLPSLIIQILLSIMKRILMTGIFTSWWNILTGASSLISSQSRKIRCSAKRRLTNSCSNSLVLFHICTLKESFTEISRPRISCLTISKSWSLLILAFPKDSKVRKSFIQLLVLHTIWHLRFSMELMTASATLGLSDAFFMFSWAVTCPSKVRIKDRYSIRFRAESSTLITKNSKFARKKLWTSSVNSWLLIHPKDFPQVMPSSTTGSSKWQVSRMKRPT